MRTSSAILLGFCSIAAYAQTPGFSFSNPPAADTAQEKRDAVTWAHAFLA